MRVGNRQVQRLCFAGSVAHIFGRFRFREIIGQRSGKSLLLLLFGLLMLPAVVLAQSNHPSCRTDWSGNYTCSMPQVPSAPVISPSPSVNGSVTVMVYSSDPYSWIVLNTGHSSRGSFSMDPTFSISGLSPGTHSFRAKRCLSDGSRDFCSSYSALTSVTVLGTPGAPSVSAISPNACGATLSFSWLPGSGYPTGSTAYYHMQESVNGGNWANVSGYTNTTATSRSPSTTERATYRYAVRSRYYLSGTYSNYSGWSYTSTLTMPECAPGKPGTPSPSHANFETGTNVNINWTPASVAIGKVLGYRVQRYHSSTGWVALNACTTSGTSCPDNDPHTRGQTYQYRVQAYKHTVDGPWSTAASVTIKYATPAKPATPTYPVVTTSGYTVNWSGGGNSNTGSISYQLWDSGTGSWISVGGATSRTFTGRSAATTYQHKVKACNPQSICTESNTSSINIPGTPGAISIDAISDAGRSYTVGWSAAGGSVSSYELQRSTNGGQSWSAVTNQDGVLLSEAVSNASAGTTYQYRVRACNSQACGAYTAVRQYWVPAVPSVTPILNASTLSLSLSWPALPASHYQLDRSVNGGSWQSVSTSYAQTSYTTSVVNGYTYAYRVRACNANNACSANAEMVSVVPPAAPATISAGQPAPADRTEVTVSWSTVSGLADGYHLERRNVTAGDSFTQIAQIIGSGTASYTDNSGLQPNTEYQYRVRAYKGSLNGAYSPDSSSLRIRFTRPTVNLFVSGASQQTADVYSAGYNGIYTLNWAASGSATSFNVTELEPDGAWQAASQTALQCAANQCDYDKPFNDSGADHVYRYRGQACNVDYCSVEREVTVNVKTYPTPGPATTFSFQFDGTPSDGAYTLLWSAPLNTPPNVTGPNAEAVTHYQLFRTSPAGEGPWQTTHSDTRIEPYTQSFAGGTSGQTYIYEIVACFTPNEPNAQTVCSGASSLEVRIPYAPPNQPGGLNHTGLDAQAGDYTLVWNAASGQVSYYEIERLIDGQWIYFATATTASHPVTGHPNGQSRSYRVRACNVDDCGDYTGAYEVYVPHLTPGTPTGLIRQSLDATERRMTLAWGAPLNGGQVQTYEIEQSVDSGANWQATATTAGQTLTVNELTGGTNYRFRARACNVDACGVFSTELAAYLPYAAPGTPGAISHDAAENNPGQGAFTVRWTAPATIDSALAPITHYRLEYSANGGSIWLAAPVGGATSGQIAVSSPAANAPASATVSGLTTGAAYSLRVRACNADTCGNNTAAYQVYLPLPAPGTPAWLPTNPSTQDYELRRFTVQWTPPAAGTVSHYQLEAYAGLVNDNDAWVPVAETPATGYAFIDRVYGETYRYRVRACSESQSSSAYCSAWAVSGDTRLKYPVPNTPGGIAVSNQSGGNYTLSWNGVLGWAPEYRYQLQENRDSAGWQTLTELTDPTNLLAITGRTPATYSYRVRACNPAPDNDCGSWSPATPVTVLPTPGVPGSLSIDDLDGNSCQFNLAWTPPTGGQGTYHYEVAVQVAGGNQTSLAWTTGTSHNMIVNQNDSGVTHTFRVRARTLSNGQYSLWGPWRSAGAATSCDYSLNSTGDQLYILAPRYSESGQYTVNMRYTGNWAPGLEYRYQMWAQGTGWSSLGASVAPPNMVTVTYGSSNPQPTNRYRYRVSACDFDLYPNDNPMTCSSTIDSTWDTLAIDTTVLRDPGSVGQLQAAGLPNPVEQVYIVPDGQFTLNWQVAPNNPGPSTQVYEIQYKPVEAVGDDAWMLLAEQSDVGRLITLPAFGVPFDFRVRACAYLDDYVNCGSWSRLNYPVKQSIGPPRFAVNTYPSDGKLVIYDRRVPLQWLPPFGMADGGIHHYEISLRSRQTDDGGEAFWVGPDILATPAPVNGSNSNPPVQQAMVEIEQGGQKEFLIRACGASGSSSCGEALTFPITVIVPPDPPEQPSGLMSQADPDSYTGGRFNGALSGEFSVQPSGAAAYSLPIVVPPGTAGMQPNLSLNYSSQAGNGVAGMGWSVGGLSSITHCNKTLARDGVSRGVDFSDNDAYCLDGQRLISIGNNQYRTEINDFRRITRMTGGACDVWFEVRTQDGQTLEYGNTADSCIDASRNSRTNTAENVIHGWALNRSTDVSGNYIAYKYEEEAALGANSFVIDRIEYTGHNSSAPYTAVDFRYETGRPDSVGGYQGGVGTQQTRRLVRITTGVNPADISDDPAGYGVYTLNYEADGDLISRLTSIEYCATDGSDGSVDTLCMEPLEFEWSPWQPGWEPLAGYTPPLPFSGGYPGKDLGARLIDLDNDGLQDLLYARTGSRIAYRNTGTGWQSWPAYTPPIEFVDGDGKDLGVQLADINGDDRPELLTSVGNASGTYNVYQNTGSGWSLNASLALPEPVTTYKTFCRTGLRINQPATDNGLRLADLNGDGLNDLIQGASDGTTRRAWRNTGDSANRWQDWPQYAPPVRLTARRSQITDWPINPPQGFDDPAYDTTGWLADFNGDSLPDLLYKTVPHPQSFGNREIIEYRMRLNTGSGWGPAESAHFASIPLDVEADGPDAGIRLADLNGDGLPDLMRGNHADDLIAYNTGNSWLTTVPFETTPNFQSVLGNIEVRPHNRLLLDLNYDGRTDILLGGSAWLSSEDAGDGWKEMPEYGAPYQLGHYPAAMRIADINGDGRNDLLGAIESSNVNGAWTQRSGPRRITAVKDGLGNSTGIRYKALTDRSLDGRGRPIYSRTETALNFSRERELNVPMQVVDRITMDDGIGGELVTEYAYSGLTVAINGRGPLGFDFMTAYKPNGTVAVTRYGKRFPYSGLPLEVTVSYGSGANALQLDHTVNEYCYAVTSASTIGGAGNPETSGFTSASANCGEYDDAARDNEAVFVFPRRTTVTSNQLSDNLQSVTSTVTTVTENTYGVFGYPAHSLVTTTGDGHTYTTETSHVYDGSQPDWRWLGRVQEMTITRRVDGAYDGNNTLKTRYEYYNTNGLLKKEILEPDEQAPLKMVTAHGYDQFGNATQTTVCASDFSYCEAGAVNPNAGSAGSEPFRTTAIQYDLQGRYPINSANALNHSETYKHAHSLGLRTEMTGANGLVTSWVYDSLGRKISETNPFGTTTFEYWVANGGYVPGARYSVQENRPGMAPARLYYDGKGRERRRLTQSMHGEWVATDIEYDHFGREARISEPYFVYGTYAGDTHWTITEYDALDRVTRVLVPLGDISGDGVDDGVAETSSEYLGFETIATDAKGRRKLKEQNALGQAVRTVDDLDGKNISVEYGYDSQGNLETTTVDNNPATTVTLQFDKRGHKVGLTDPDMGHWDYRHNGFGELVWQRDAKQQVTEMDYDPLGRMVERREWPAGGAVQMSSWEYDTASGAGIGKLHREQGPAGDLKVYSYTDRGQLAQTEYNFDVNGWTQGFIVSRNYDAIGREQLIRYPEVGGERLTVENVYSPFGGLWYVLDTGDSLESGDESVYWIAEMVDVRGQLIQETLRNRNTINNSTNSATGWLQKVESWDKDLNIIQQTFYAFDQVGNVEARARLRPWIVNPDGSFQAGSNEQVIEAFAYDSLDRLFATAVIRDGSIESIKNNDYDNLGNFLYKDETGNAYGYNTCNAGPHAVCTAGGTAFTYDANGNMVESTGAKARTIEYSVFNKPTLITENGSSVHFAYGADRARVFKQSLANGRTEITWYVGLGEDGQPLYEQTAVVEGGQIVSRQHLHFIYAGSNHNGQAFAVRVQDEAEDNDAGQPNFIRYSGTEYYHRDHLGSVIAITGDTGAVEETRLLSFDAWGKRRNADWSETPDGDDQYTLEGMRGNLAYTGQEAIPEVGLIHMNGRVYDPELGIFLSADPHVQSVDDSQSYHRYSYVRNNPLKYTDPSGYFLKNLLEQIPSGLATIIGVALSFIPGCQGWCSALFNAAYASANGATFGEALLGGALSFFGAGFGQAAASGLGNSFAQAVVRGAVAGAFTGGINAALNGGNFFRGALKGALHGAAMAMVMQGINQAVASMQPEDVVKMYLVRKDAEGNFTDYEEVDGVYTKHAAVNGILNKLPRAAELMGKHVEAAFGEVTEYTLVHNPTGNFFADILECAADKLGLTTDVAKGLAKVLAGVQESGQTVQWVAHSQGGLIFTEAVRFHMANGGGSLSNNHVRFHGGANNRWSTNSIMGNAGVSLIGKGYYSNPADLVPQVLGLNALFNPLKIVGSVLASPGLFMDETKSPHTLPYIK